MLRNSSLIVLFALTTFGIYFFLSQDDRVKEPENTSLHHAISDFQLLNPVNARIRINLLKNTLSQPEKRVHTTRYVNNTEYAGLSDNDLRGFLDGNSLRSWNQATQIHVRIGRRERGAKKGQYELFRVLQKWEDIYLPKHARVESATIRISVEKYQEFPVNLMLYSINKDWDPGNGGIKQDNNSIAITGEVWWGELSADIEQWGLPGAGYSSDSHPNADRPLMPLAVTTYNPGDQHLTLSSGQLAEYIQNQAAEEKPLLFLLKLADYDEDKKGSRIEIYSAEQGDDLNINNRRPSLTINWSENNTVKAIEKDILLEYGKYYYFPRMDTIDADSIVIDSILYKQSGEPIVEMRTGTDSKISNWYVINHAKKINNWDWIEIRVSQLKNKVVLGSPFESSFRDTWVVTAKPEEQIVPWTFISPEGEHIKVEAQYDGNNTWRIQFYPDVPGRWKYYWNSNFIQTPYTSEVGEFDVISGDKVNIVAQLTKMLEQIKNVRKNSDADITDEYFEKFSRLERAFMETQTPETFSSDESLQARGILNEIRKTIDPLH